MIKTRIAEVDDFLAPTYANWNRVDAGRIVARRGDLTEAQKIEFMGLRETGLGLKGELEIQQKETVQKKKKLTELEAGLKQLRNEIKNVQGPLEAKAAHVMEFKLGMKRNVWWGDFIGPAMSPYYDLMCMEGTT